MCFFKKQTTTNVTYFQIFLFSYHTDKFLLNQKVGYEVIMLCILSNVIILNTTVLDY